MLTTITITFEMTRKLHELILILYQGQYPECFGRPMPEVNGLNQKKSSRIPGSIQLFPLQVIQSSSLFLSAYSIMYLFIALLNPKAVTALNPLKRCWK